MEYKLIISEILGKYVGYLPGLIFAPISVLRHARVFHPQGYLFEAEVHSDFLPPYALIRFSSALWKKKEWTDVLGVALRFSQDITWDLDHQENYQDILLVTSPHVWSLPLAFFSTRHHDFLANRYFAITDFLFEGEIIKMRILCEGCDLSGTRIQKLNAAIETGSAKLILQMQSAGEWVNKAEIILKRPSDIDQERLTFTPFHATSGLVPKGFVNYLRLRTYELCQAARLSLLKNPKSLKVSPPVRSVFPGSSHKA